MVYFVCATCGTSLKKNQVSSHWFKCRQDKHVSCMDCGKDFWGEDYNNHLKCITEDQKYGGSNYVMKENKGERKQEEWVMKIKEKVSSTSNMEPQLKDLLQKIILHSNIPRKEAKFRNFMRSSCRVSNIKLVDKVWEIFKDANTKSANSSSSNGAKKVENVTNVDNNATSRDVSQASSEAVKEDIDTVTGDTDTVKLNKRERKELRREKQSKKSKKDKHAEHGSKGKSGSKRKLECIEDEEPEVEAEEPKKKKKRKKGDDSLEQVMETAEVKKKKKKKKGGISQEDALLHDGEDNIKNGTIETNGNHMLEKGKENLVEPQHPTVFKWTSAIKRVLKEAPEEGMKVSKLQRKVLSLYYNAYGEAPNIKSKQELVALLSHKLNKKNKFIMHKDRVKLQK